MKKSDAKLILDAIADNRVMRLHAVNISTRSRPEFKCAITDPSTGGYLTGAEIFDDPEFEKHPAMKRAEAIKAASVKLCIAPDNVAEKDNGDKTPAVRFEHNMKLDLKNDRDCSLLLLATLDGGLAFSKSSVNTMQHRFYIEDKKAEAGTKLKTLTSKAKALKLIEDIKPYDIDQYVALLGIYSIPSNYSIAEKELAIYNMADTQPDKILSLFSDNLLEQKLILQGFLNKGLVRFNGFKKEYTANGNLIGTTFNEALAFIMDEKNQSVINEWRKALKRKPAETEA